MKTSKLTGERIKEYLAEGKRFDNRRLEEFREIVIETGISKNAEGSAKVKIGKTEVIVGIKMDIAEPYPDSPKSGNLMVTAELLPLSSSNYELGPPKIESIELARVTDRAIRESKCIDFDKLCIKEGEKVWTVFIDIYSINADGNLLDAAEIGAITALKNTKIPKYDKKEEKVVYGESSDKLLPLSKDLPISVTFYKLGDSIIVDPTREEEDISETRITIGSANGVISSMQKGGSKELKEEEIYKILDSLEKIWKNLNSKIEKAVK